MLYCVFAADYSLLITTKLVTCPCRCQSLSVCPVGACVCFRSLLSCLIIINLSYSGLSCWLLWQPVAVFVYTLRIIVCC